jgi:class 3 adenylate cyclase/tetratricopeptide (TPR) repeat protein
VDTAGSGAPTISGAAGRKLVTVVFADLAGSTALEERMDPESVRAVMQRYYALVREVVEARGGRVVKFIGDGAMAVFGVPETHEDDALRALDAALAVHEAFAALAGDVERDRGVAISLRVGVNTGEVVVGVDDDDVVGDAVNVAARLERAAAPGAVLVGEATWRLTRGAAVFEDAQELHVAGKAEKVRARPLVGVQYDGSEVRVEFVGRSREIEALQSEFNEAVQTGLPRLVTVVGSPGVGKTRLGMELERMVASEALALVAACTRETAVPLAPVAEALRSVWSAEEESAIERLTGMFGEGDSDQERVTRTLSAIVETGAGATPEETLWALRRLMEALARTGPVVLILDDLQWAETMLLDLVEHLAEWTRGALLLVVLARPELRDRRAALADGGRHRLLGLEGLGREDTMRLACQLLGADALPVELLDRLPASTGGNPLFVRELLRMLVDDAVLAADDEGRWTLRVAPEAIDVPPTIQSLLAARLDRLGPAEQVVLERASISGAEFPLGALVELLPAERRREASTVVEQLRRKELVESAGSYWIDEPVYRFHHVLIRDAAYRRLLREERAALHETMAAWIDAKTSAVPGEYDELAGHHLEQAYLQRRELGPLDEHMVAVGRTASRRLGAAAQRALDRDDPAAASLAGRALDCLPAGDAARAELLLVRCEALLSAADAVHARDAVRELEGVAASSPRLRAWGACFAAQLATLIDPAHLRETEQGAAAVAAELAALGDDRGAAKAHAVHAGALARLGRFAEVEDALDRALTAAHAAGDRRLATLALAAAPVAAVWGPSPVPRAGGRCLDVVRLLRITAGSPVVEATSLRCQAVLEAFRGRIDAARRLVASAHEMLTELGLVHGLLEADMFAAIVEIVAGDVDAAAEQLRRAYDGLRQLGAEADAARAGALLAHVEMERGNLEEAERLAHEAEDLAGDDLQAGIAWRRVQAEVLARRGHHDEAMELAEAAVAIASRTDALVQHADACLGLAAVRRAAGDLAGWAQATAEAAQLYDRKGATALVEAARRALDGHTGGMPAEPPSSLPSPDAERAAAGQPTTAPAELSNRCTETYARYWALFATRDWEGMRDLVTDDAVYDDRRPVVRTLAMGSDIEAQLRQIAAHGVERFAIAVLATRGERLALMKVRSESTDPAVEQFADESLTLIELTDSGRLHTGTGFAVDDLDGAVAELDGRYIEGEGAPYAAIIAPALAAVRFIDARDWDAWRACSASNAVVIEHLYRGWGGASDRDASEALVRQAMDAIPASHVMVRRIHAVCDRAVAYETQLSHGASDTSAEEFFHSVSHLGPSGIDRVETFGPDALDEALSCYRRLGSPVIETLSNRCIQTALRSADSFASRDWETFTETMSVGLVYEDHRTVMRTQAAGRREVVAGMQIAAEEGADRLVFTPLAVRGDHLALVQTSFESSADVDDFFPSVMLAVFSSADDSPVQSISIYDLDDRDQAMAELDRRYIEGEGAPYADILSLVLACNRAINGRDWESLRSCFAPDVVMRDHQWGLAGAAGQGRVEEMARQAMDAAPGSHLIVSRVHAVSDCALAFEECVAVGAGSALTVGLVHQVAHLGPSGIDRVETFGPDALDDALAAYCRLAAPALDTLSNRCTETYRHVCEHFAARDWDAFTAGMSEDFVYDDHRSVVNTPAVGRRDAVAHMQIAAEQGADRLVFTPLAARGANHALVRMGTQSTADAENSFGSVMLGVISTTKDGRLERTTVYDLDDEDQAMAELDRRYTDGEGALYAAILSLALAHFRAINRRDWESLRRSFSPGVVVRDHQWGGLAEVTGPERAEEMIRHAMDAVPSSHLIVRQIHAVSDGALTFETSVSHGAGTSFTDAQHHEVLRLGSSGIDCVESFGPGALDDALAAYRRLAAPALDMPSNRSTETQRRICEHFAARDWDGFTAGMSEDFVYDDHRSVVNTEAVGRREAVVHMQIAAEQGADRLVFAALAVRGANHALVRMGTQSNADAENSFASVMLAVISNTNDGRQDRVTVYDLDDEDRAIADLERRYIEDEGAPYAEMLTLFAEGTRALNQRDWDHFQACFSPAAAHVDHYSAGWDSRRGGADMLAAFIDFARSLSGARTIQREIHACTTDALLATTVVSGRSEDGGAVEFVFHVVCHRAGRVVDHTESFSCDALDDALAAYRRLTADSAPGNQCTEVFDRWADRFAARDWDGMGALVADDYIYLDHRPVVGVREVGRDDHRRTMEILAEQGGDRVVYTILATRGERQALLRLGVQSDRDVDDSFASVMLGVVTTSPDDRFASITVFGLDDEERARAELERVYERAEGRPANG